MPPRKGTPQGRCTICAHVERPRIELLLAGGAGQTSVARKYKVSNDAVHRHWRDHVPAERRARLIMGPVPQQALAAQICEENTSVLDNLRIVRAGLWTQYDAALEAGDRFGVATLAGKLHNNLQITAKITGELASSPLVTINNQQNNVSVMAADPAFAAFQARLIGVLRNHPDARLAVIAEFSKLDAPEREAPQLTQGDIHEAAPAAA